MQLSKEHLAGETVAGVARGLRERKDRQREQTGEIRDEPDRWKGQEERLRERVLKRVAQKCGKEAHMEVGGEIHREMVTGSKDAARIASAR